ncbi:unnamed protein product [Bursaphelenchus okinawaensis]|uniref:CUB domain-containing protein n=1 Tax=Bursaphelenchus okinawaensis TaxID=465554 RepID=A0A811L441_9BILA|nr:unnamed protein product [Bursaphelenchus okinawaensis]CAG9115725.1 unnamed protein product [Bursaphelenchus okinawaensis]
MMTYNFFRVAFVLPYFCLSVQGSHYKVGDLKISCPNDDWVSVGTNCFYHSSKAYDAHSGQVFCQKLFGQSLATQSLLHTANFYQLSELAQHIPDATFWTSFYINVAVNDKIDSHDAFEKIRVHSRSLINISTPLINPNWAKLQPNLLKGKTWHNGTLCVAFNANKTDIQNYGWSLKQCNELFGVICQTFGCLNYTNGPSEFRCTDNSACIPKAHMCDHVQDCLDNSDENCAPETENCNNFQYQAIKNGRIKIDKVVNRDISHCNWHIEFADADNVVINLLTLGMSSSYIIITEVESGIVHQLDNNKTQITVPANVFIAYNGEATHNGIEIRYHAEGNSICNKTFVSWDGSFSPPMQTAHPNLYRTSTNCEWTIANTEQKPLAIKIPRFWLAKTDYLLIYEFTNNIASLLGNFTKYQPPPVAFVTMQQNLLFRFRTVKNTVGADGFTVFFERKCLEVTVETTHGYIQSTNFNKVFPFVAFEQTYRIVVPCKPYTKCSTQLFFDHLNITNFDDITVKSGNKTQILSGSTIPMPFRAEAPIIEIGMIAMTDKFSAKITFSVDCELPTSNRIRLINPSTTSYRSIVSFGCTYDKNWHLFNATCGAGGIWSDIPNICTQQPKGKNIKL